MIPGVRRSLDIQLSKKVSLDTLKLLADELKALDTSEYAQTFIVYYLPGMLIGGGGWAISHFRPNLEVQILGLTIEQEELLIAETEALYEDMLGRWLDERPYAGALIAIFREDGMLFAERITGDGRKTRTALNELEFDAGRRFDLTNDSNSSEYYVLTQAGDLEIHDEVGIIAVAMNVD